MIEMFGNMLVLGIFLNGAFLCLSLINLMIYSWFKWISDGEEVFQRDWYANFVMTKILGFHRREWIWKYENAKGFCTDGYVAIVFSAVALFLLPTCVYVCYLQPLIPVVLVTFIAVSFALRGVKRLIKELKAHKQDKDAHK